MSGSAAGGRCSTCGGTLDRAEVEICAACRPSSDTPAYAPPVTTVAPDPLVGSTVGAYEVLAAVGAGGMGQVYRARHRRLGRTVALKVLPPGSIDDAERRRRFVEEARSASKLDHPNIVTVHDLVSEDGRDILVMEYVDGPTLAEVIPAEGLPLERALRYARQMASALAAAHRAGIVHRDLKPGNVMIAAGDQAKLMDFGLAKLTGAGADPEGATATALTRFGAVLGTVFYMSPEQAQGEPIDPRSDIFSFGAVLYEMLAGRRPFVGASRLEVMHKIVFEPSEPIDVRRPDVPQEIVALVERAMAKKREDRFTSSDDMLPLLGTDAESPVALKGWARTRRRLAAALGRGGRRRRVAALLATLLLAVAVTAIPASREALRHGASAALSMLIAPGDGADDLSALAPHELYARGMTLLRDAHDKEGVEEARDLFQRAIASDADHAASYAGLGRAQWRLYKITGDPLYLDQALFSADRALELDDQLSAPRVARGLALVDLGRLDEAEEEFTTVRALDPDNADAWRGLGEVASRRGRMEEAEEHYRQAIARDPENSMRLLMLGWALYRQGRYEEAEEQYRRAIELRPDAPNGYQTLAAALHMQGRYAEAATALQRALEIQPTKGLYTNLGTLYFFQGLYPNAVTAFERAVEMGANSYLNWANLGDGYRWSPGQEDKAQAAYLRAIQLLEAQLEEEPTDPTLRSRLAVLRAKRGDRDEALELARTLADRQDLDASTLYRLALAHEIAGDRAAALAALRAALVEGYSPTEVESDPELTALRGDPAYQLLVAKIRGRGETVE